MTRDEIKKWMLESRGFPVTQANAEYLERFQAIAFQAGAASRDAEIQRLQFALADSEALELGTAEHCDQLLAHINALRDAFQTFIDEHEECQDADEWMAELCSIEALHVADEALATTPEQSLAAYRDAEIAELKEDLHFQACLTKYLMPYQERAVLAEKERDQLREQVALLRDALKEAVEDYSDRFDMSSPSTNPGIKMVVKQGKEALAATEPKP